jgi:hypothetical protein
MIEALRRRGGIQHCLKKCFVRLSLWMLSNFSPDKTVPVWMAEAFNFFNERLACTAAPFGSFIFFGRHTGARFNRTAISSFSNSTH